LKSTGNNLFNIKAGRLSFQFSPKTGRLIDVALDGKQIGFSNGPFPVWEAAVPPPATWRVSARHNGEAIEISAQSQSDTSWFKWTILPDGVLELTYRFALPAGLQNYWGIGFDLDEAAVCAKRWRGDGPFRIWNNRRRGPTYGLWENKYNKGIPGEVWELPAFSGVFANVDWMRIDLASGANLLMVPDAGTREIGVLQPPNSEQHAKAIWAYPTEGGLFAFHKVPAVGTKFKTAEQLGPQSQPQPAPEAIEGKIMFMIHPASSAEEETR
jgi:hypothetical protein